MVRDERSSHGNPLVLRHWIGPSAGQADESDPAVTLPLVTDKIASTVRFAVVHEVPVDVGFSLVDEHLEPLRPSPGVPLNSPGVSCSPAMETRREQGGFSGEVARVAVQVAIGRE